MPIFCRKNVNSHENTSLSYIFLGFLEKPLVGKPLFGQKTSIMSKMHYNMGKKVNGMPFFPIFYEKFTAPIPMICQKHVHSLKTHIALMPVFCRKNVQSFKNTVLSCHFFQILNEKPQRCHAHIIFDQKTSILSKLYYIMDQKS